MISLDAVGKMGGGDNIATEILGLEGEVEELRAVLIKGKGLGECPGRLGQSIIAEGGLGDEKLGRLR